jgi:hypothetical protein
MGTPVGGGMSYRLAIRESIAFADEWRSMFGAEKFPAYGFACAPVYASLCKKHGNPLRSDLSNAEKSDIQGHLWHVTAWGLDGFPTFDLTHDLYASLLATDAPGEPGLFNFPYRAFTIRIPQQPVLLQAIGRSGPESITQIDVSKYLLIGKAFAGESAGAGVDSIQGITKLAAIMGKPDIWREHIMVRGLTESGLSVHSAREWPAGWAWGDTDDKDLDESMSPDDLFSLRRVHRLVENFCLYVGSHAADVQPLGTKTSGSVRRADKGYTPIRRWIVGRSIKLGGPMRRYLFNALGDHQDSKLRSLTVRYLVRGHWRNQACGPQMADRKNIWVAPYWKGPTDTDAALVRLYDAQAVSA